MGCRPLQQTFAQHESISTGADVTDKNKLTEDWCCYVNIQYMASFYSFISGRLRPCAESHVEESSSRPNVWFSRLRRALYEMCSFVNTLLGSFWPCMSMCVFTLAKSNFTCHSQFTDAGMHTQTANRAAAFLISELNTKRKVLGFHEKGPRHKTCSTGSF